MARGRRFRRDKLSTSRLYEQEINLREAEEEEYQEMEKEWERAYQDMHWFEEFARECARYWGF